MENIDESKRKPRRTRGTPAFQYRNRFAYTLIAAGAALFTVWAYTPIFQQANKRLCDALFVPTEEELDRRGLFDMSKPRTSRAIQESIDEKKEIMSSR